MPICYVGAFWLSFSLIYTVKTKYINKKVFFFLFLPPTIFYIFVLTNERHYLFFSTLEYGKEKTWGNLFYCHAVTTYIYLLIASILLIAKFIKQFSKAKSQCIVLIITVLFPYLGNVLMIFHMLPYSNTFDVTSIGLSISFLILSIHTFKYKFMNIERIALRKIIDNMKEAIIVIDDCNAIVDYNDSFKTLFPDFDVKVNMNVDNFTEYLQENTVVTPESTSLLQMLTAAGATFMRGEIVLYSPLQKIFSVYIQNIGTNNGSIYGKIMIFNDITDYRGLLDDLDQKNRDMTIINEELISTNVELASANEKLRDYAETVEKLSIERERIRISRDMHDTLGHTMVLLVAALEVSKIISQEEKAPNTNTRISECIKIAKEGIKDLRYSISGMISKKFDGNNFLKKLNSLIDDFSVSNVNIDFYMEGDIPSTCRDEQFYVIYRVVQEALTNSLKHGDPKNVNIMLIFDSQKIKLYIFDNGEGSKQIKKGFGLSSMQHRIERIKGKLIYGSDGESGFNINVEIPLRGIDV